MSLTLTPEMLVAAYEFVRTTQPFCGWKLPESDEVAFSVNKHPAWLGAFGLTSSGVPQIDISAKCVGHITTLIRAMAHEMIHLAQWVVGEDNNSKHNAAFHKRARQVCKHHGWDYKVFV